MLRSTARYWSKIRLHIYLTVGKGILEDDRASSSWTPFLRLLLENYMFIINRVYICSYRLYVDHPGISTLERFHQKCKHHYRCKCVTVK